MKRYMSLTYTQVQEVLDNHDKQRELMMKRRLDLFTNAFLKMTFNAQPRRIRRATVKLDISFDQTFLPPPTNKGFSLKTLAKRVREEATGQVEKLSPGPVDPWAGWYPKKGDRPDFAKGTVDTTGPEDARRYENSLEWGWMLNIAVRVDSEHPERVRAPKIAVAATMSMPNVGVSEEAVELMRAALGTGLAPGLADADKQYWANALPERLHLPAESLGWTASTDYRVDRLGVQGGKGGVEFIEDGRYCPGMPKRLKTATQDLLEGEIDEEVFQIRRGERRAFQHKHARNSIESLNAGIKDSGKEDIEEASRRRVRGFGAAQVFATILLTNFNLRKIASFLKDEETAEAAANKGGNGKPKNVRRRDLLWDNPYTKTTARESILAIQLRGELNSPLRT